MNSNLPLKVQYVIFDYLDLESLLFKLFITDNNYWCHRYIIDFGHWKGDETDN